MIFGTKSKYIFFSLNWKHTICLMKKARTNSELVRGKTKKKKITRRKPLSLRWNQNGFIFSICTQWNGGSGRMGRWILINFTWSISSSRNIRLKFLKTKQRNSECMRSVQNPNWKNGKIHVPSIYFSAILPNRCYVAIFFFLLLLFVTLKIFHYFPLYWVRSSLSLCVIFLFLGSNLSHLLCKMCVWYQHVSHTKEIVRCCDDANWKRIQNDLRSFTRNEFDKKKKIKKTKGTKTTIWVWYHSGIIILISSSKNLRVCVFYFLFFFSFLFFCL